MKQLLMDIGHMTDTFRLAEILGSLSLATDFAAGQMPESALGATIVSMRIGDILELPDEDLVDMYYTCVTRFIGCTSTATEAAGLGLGDDLSLNYSLTMSDPADRESMQKQLELYFALEAPEDQRRETIQGLIGAIDELPYAGVPHCEQAIALTKRLPVPDNVPSLLNHLESRWDGKNPTKLGGTDLPLISRIIEFAVVAELYRRAGGISAVVEMTRIRSGGQFDPEICRLADLETANLFAGFNPVSNWELYLNIEPIEPRMVSSGELSTIALAFADFTDNKSGWFLGHSRQVAELVNLGAEAMNLPANTCNNAQNAALLHDIGRAAVPNGIWEKPVALSTMEIRKAQSHSYHTENILALCPVFNNLVHVACSAQERSDGSGYHRHSKLEDPCAGLLAAANMYNALTHARPWREAFTSEKAADVLLDEVAARRLPRDQVRAILDAAGHRKQIADLAYPDGLTRREVEVLALLARGRTNKEIADDLFIAPKTVDNHLQKVYEKTNARSRTAAAMYALENGIIEI